MRATVCAGSRDEEEGGKTGCDVKVSMLFQSCLRLPTGMPNPKAMTASSHIESAGTIEGSRANVMVRPCSLLCACTDMPFSIVFSYSVVLVVSCCTVQFFAAHFS